MTEFSRMFARMNEMIAMSGGRFRVEAPAVTPTEDYLHGQWTLANGHPERLSIGGAPVPSTLESAQTACIGALQKALAQSRREAEAYREALAMTQRQVEELQKELARLVVRPAAEPNPLHRALSVKGVGVGLRTNI